MKLTREVRVLMSNRTGVARPTNSWAGTTEDDEIGPFWSMRATVEGRIDADTGFLCNIVQIDRFLRQSALPCLQRTTTTGSMTARTLSAGLIRTFGSAPREALASATLSSLQLLVSPYTSLTVCKESPGMAMITQAYEFAASHRLYCASMSEEENERLFGKCANANGHGHNYVVEVTIEGRPDETSGFIFDLPRLDLLVKQVVTDRFDHKHLNLDCPEFRSLNPSVENIARVIWKLLRDAIGGDGLRNVRVRETPKTYAEYSGD